MRRPKSRWPVALLLAAVSLVSTGCFVPASQVRSLRAQHDQLVQRNQAMHSEIANLATSSQQLQQQLVQAEEELALVDRRGRTDRRQLSNYELERERLYHQLGDGAHGHPHHHLHDRLAEFAGRYPSCYYDPATGVAKLDTDVLFDTGHAELRPEAREMLADFASIMRSADAEGLKLMVVGHTDDQKVKGADALEYFPNNWHLGAARALAVCDHLRVRGVREDRMGIASYGRFQPVAANTSNGNRQRNRRVELFLIAPDVPVVGWTETFTSIYR